MSLDPTEQEVELKRLSDMSIQIFLGGKDAAAACGIVHQLSTSAAVTSLNSHTHPSFEHTLLYNNISNSSYLGELIH